MLAAEVGRRAYPTRPLAAAALGATALGLSASVAPVAVVALALLALGATAVWLLPRWSMPSVALAVYALIPLNNLPVPDTATTVSPSLLLAVFWMVRLWRDDTTVRRDQESRLLLGAIAATLGLLLVTSLNGAYLKTGLGWTLAFVVNALLTATALRVEIGRARTALVATWTVLAGSLGIYAVVEVLVLKANPVLQAAESVGGDNIEQIWAVYRATTTLGHPLENAAFFAIGATLALATAVRTGSRGYGLGSVCAIAGLAATGSRGPTAALLVGVVWVMLAQAGRVPRARIAALAVVLILSAGAALVVQLGRSGSAEADSSSQYRAVTAQQGIDTVRESPWLGVGAGASSVAKEEGGGSLAMLSYENGWLEAAVSNGVPFLVLLLGFFVAALVTAWRRRHVEAGAALAVAMIVMGNSNVLEGNRQGLIRFGFLLGLALTPAVRDRRTTSVSGSSVSGSSGTSYIRE